MALQVRIRHRQPLQDAVLASRSDGQCELRFAEPQRAAAPGQFAVFYARDGECLGCAEIDAVHPVG